MQKILWKIESLWEPIEESSAPQIAFSPWESDFFISEEVFEKSQSQKPVYTDNYGEYLGLDHWSLLFQGTKPIFVMDNHNAALFAFLEISEKSAAPLPVLHIDAHPDEAPAEFEVPMIGRGNIQDVYDKSRIGDFLDVATRGGLIGEITRVVTSAEFENFTVPKESYILNLDIDIFGPEGAHEELERKVRVIKRAWVGASAIIVATSPGFIDQDFAQEIVKIFTRTIY